MLLIKVKYFLEKIGETEEIILFIVLKCTEQLSNYMLMTWRLVNKLKISSPLFYTQLPATTKKEKDPFSFTCIFYSNSSKIKGYELD